MKRKWFNEKTKQENLYVRKICIKYFGKKYVTWKLTFNNVTLKATITQATQTKR